MLPLIGLGIGLAGTVGKMIARRKNNKEMDKLLTQDPVYQKNPLVAQRLGLAQTLLNARMPGAARYENNVYGTQANTIASNQRSASSGAQLMAANAAAAANADNSFNNLEEMELQDYQRRFGNYNSAVNDEVQEGDKLFSDEQRRFGNKVQVGGAKAENRMNTWSDIANTGFSMADFGANGGFKNMFKRKRGDNTMRTDSSNYD